MLKIKYLQILLSYVIHGWNEDISEDDAFIKALRLADGFWEVYIKNAVAEVEGIEVILDKASKCKENYLILDREMPYKKAMQISDNNKIKYVIFKSRREGYEIRTVMDSCNFKDEIVFSKDLKSSKKITKINELTYVDNHGRLCCTETLDSAIRLVDYNEKDIEMLNKNICKGEVLNNE